MSIICRIDQHRMYIVYSTISMYLRNKYLQQKQLQYLPSESFFNPLLHGTISKLLEMINKSTHVLVSSVATAPDSDMNQTAGLGGSLSM